MLKEHIESKLTMPLIRCPETMSHTKFVLKIQNDIERSSCMNNFIIAIVFIQIYERCAMGRGGEGGDIGECYKAVTWQTLSDDEVHQM